MTAIEVPNDPRLLLSFVEQRTYPCGLHGEVTMGSYIRPAWRNIFVGWVQESVREALDRKGLTTIRDRREREREAAASDPYADRRVDMSAGELKVNARREYNRAKARERRAAEAAAHIKANQQQINEAGGVVE